MLDNSIKWDNKLGIDPRRVVWRRCVDMNDRQLRNVVDGMGGIGNWPLRRAMNSRRASTPAVTSARTWSSDRTASRAAAAVSSSGAPGACMTPSSVMNERTMSFRIGISVFFILAFFSGSFVRIKCG